MGVTLRFASDLMSAAGTFPTQLFGSSAGVVEAVVPRDPRGPLLVGLSPLPSFLISRKRISPAADQVFADPRRTAP